MHGGALPLLLLCFGAAAAAPAVLPRPASVHGPEPGHTGGFGEPTCRACHFDSPERPADVHVTLAGLPPAWEPGASYPVTVVLQGEAIGRAGFQLSARFADGEYTGKQAGALAAAGADVAITEAGAVQYAHHVAESTRPAAPGEARWTVTWTAPAERTGSVAFHVAANAANDDDSELGDRIVSAADTVAQAARGKQR